MRIALTHNLRVADTEEEAEFDSHETIDLVARALGRAGHRVESMDVTGPASLLVTRLEAFAPDIVFNLAEGRHGRMRRAFYPALFEQLGMPSTGSDAYVLCVTLDKALSKNKLAGWGVPTPLCRFVTPSTRSTVRLDDLPFPVIVKPNFEGSAKGIEQENVVDSPRALESAVDRVLSSYPDGALVEQYVPGLDVRLVWVEGVPRLPPVETRIDPTYARRVEIIDYRLSGVDAHALRRKAPADVSPAVLARLNDIADRAVSVFSLRDMASFNFRVAPDGQVWFLSVTAIPSLDPSGSLCASTRAVGLDYDTAVLSILRASARRHGLSALVDAAPTRVSRAKRSSLRVGLAFNMKRIDSNSGDDREAEYDAPETILSVTRAIESRGHAVVPLEATTDFPRALAASGVDLVFNIAEGMTGRNREAQIPSLCELLGVPYTGSDSAALSICLDKALAKRLLVDVDTPAFQVFSTGREKLRPLRFPVIVKPNQEGTSKGISRKSVCADEDQLRERARDLIDRYRQPALAEEYIVGREFTVGLLGERRPRVLPPMEVVFLSQDDLPVYDYECKQHWQRHVRYECPASLSKEELRSIERVCRSTFMTLGCRDVARIDLRLTPDGRVYVIEVNPLPGLTPDYSDLCLIANGAKIDYPTLIGEIMSGAIKRWQTLRQTSDPTGNAVPSRELPRARSGALEVNAN